MVERSDRSQPWPLLALFGIPHRTRGLALLRVALSITVLSNMLSHAREWRYLWGVNGVVPHAQFYNFIQKRHSFSLYMVSPHPLYQAAVFTAGILTASLFLLGWRTRITSVLFYIFTWSLSERNLFVLDGGDNLLYLFAFLLMFTNSNSHLSISPSDPSRMSVFGRIVHNYAVAAMVCQLVILYATSGLAKATGPLWQSGTAIYYVLRADEFNMTPLAMHLWHSGVLVTLITYSTMAYQISWPFLIWYRRTKLFMFAGACCMHIGIAYFMGLTWFSFVMIGAESIIFSDPDIIAYQLAFKKLVTRARLELAHYRKLVNISSIAAPDTP